MRRKLLVAMVLGAVLATTLAPTAAMADEYVLVADDHHFVFPGVGIVRVGIDDGGDFTVVAGITVQIVSEVVSTGTVILVPTTPIVIDVEPGSYEIEVEGVGSVVITVNEDGTVEIVQPLEGFDVVFIDGDFHLIAVEEPTVLLIAVTTKVVIIIDHFHHHHDDDDSSS
jgi:hypothetical protein